MSEKKRTIAEQADDIRKELDDLIGDAPLDVDNDPKDLPLQAKPTALAPVVNYTELKAGASKKAQKTITSLMKFYLDADIIEKDEYIQAKKKKEAIATSIIVYLGYKKKEAIEQEEIPK